MVRTSFPSLRRGIIFVATVLVKSVKRGMLQIIVRTAPAKTRIMVSRYFQLFGTRKINAGIQRRPALMIAENAIGYFYHFRVANVKN